MKTEEGRNRMENGALLEHSYAVNFLAPENCMFFPMDFIHS